MSIIKRILPKSMIAIFRMIKNFRILGAEFGQYRSMKLCECVDANSNPIPWYTYPAIEYLKQFNFSEKTIFEWGSGNSTLFWSERCKKIISVESDRKWYNKIKPKLPDNVEYYLFEKKDEYINSINKINKKFDIIIIDGYYRYKCAVEALKKLEDNGFIILDNSDWKENTSKLLRESGMIAVDMFGFGPINSYTWATSFYISRKVQLKPAFEQQPIHGIGSEKIYEIE